MGEQILVLAKNTVPQTQVVPATIGEQTFVLPVISGEQTAVAK